MMKRTLLLCFIHGFKGDDDTFAGFPEHIKALLSHALPNLSIAAVVYPTFDTRGDLHECVGRVKEWLINKVIDLEVSNRASSPTVDPSVRTILIGHSMGGIVAAELAMSIFSDEPIHSGDSTSNSRKATNSQHGSMIFPYIEGILAFDTPYLGISPGVVAHGAEEQLTLGKSAYEAFQNTFGGSTNSAVPASEIAQIEAAKGLPPASSAADAVSSSSPGWQRWGKYGLFAGAAAALTAGGAAAYLRRNDITQGWSWVGSHLEFVGCLARGEELKQRLSSITNLEQTHGFGFANIYTCLGRAAENKASFSSQTFGTDRTFCNLPKGELGKYFHKATNDATTMEVMAHMYMFAPKRNPGYYGMSNLAKELMTGWIESNWHETATKDDPADYSLHGDGSFADPELSQPT